MAEITVWIFLYNNLMTTQKVFPERREWILGSYEVNYIHLDYRFGFDLYGYKESNGYLRVIIMVPFFLLEGEAEIIIDPLDAKSVCEALQILHKAGEKVIVYQSGTLEVFLQGGLTLRVEKHPQYESWEAKGEGELSGMAFLCSPHEGPPWAK